MNPHGWSRLRWWSLVAGLGLLILGYAVYEFLRDDPPPDDAHLAFEFTPGPEEENGMWMLDQLEGSLEPVYQEPYLDDMIEPEDGSDPDWEAVRQRLDVLAKALDAAEDISSAPYFHGPWPPWFGSELKGLQEILHISELLEIRAALELHDQKPDEAWDTLVLILQLAERMDSSPQAMVGILVSAACKETALGSITKNPAVFASNQAQTRLRTDQLKAFQILPREVETAFRIEYAAITHAVDMLTAEAEVTYGPLVWFIYKPQRTKALLMAYHEEHLRNLPLPSIQRSFPFKEQLEANLGRFAYGHPNNIVGYSLLELCLSTYQQFLEKVDEVNANLELTRLGLALAGYANEHGGALPPTLDALAPDYINAVPLDPFTGEPFHYDPAARKVWSVGPDLADDGGLPLGDGQSRDDPHDVVVEIPAPEGPAN